MFSLYRNQSNDSHSKSTDLFLITQTLALNELRRKQIAVENWLFSKVGGVPSLLPISSALLDSFHIFWNHGHKRPMIGEWDIPSADLQGLMFSSESEKYSTYPMIELFYIRTIDFKNTSSHKIYDIMIIDMI